MHVFLNPVTYMASRTGNVRPTVSHKHLYTGCRKVCHFAPPLLYNYICYGITLVTGIKLVQ